MYVFIVLIHQSTPWCFFSSSKKKICLHDSETHADIKNMYLKVDLDDVKISATKTITSAT